MSQQGQHKNTGEGQTGQISSVKNTVGDLPIKVDDPAIKIEKGQRPPGSWPVEGTKCRGKLFNTMRVSKPFGK